jgi:hypothetical protein
MTQPTRMSQSPHPREQRLHALERFQELELEQARAQRTRLDREADEQRQRVAGLQLRLDAIRSLEVAAMTSAGGVSADVLRHTHLYLRAEAQNFLEQQEMLLKMQAAVESARISVVRNFQRLSATRRLRERRDAADSTRLLRKQLRAFDDLALVTKSNGK